MANITAPLQWALPELPSYELRYSEQLIPGISDAHLALVLPVLAYWVVSMTFHVIDVYDLLAQYRLHTPAEVAKRNRVSRWDCLRDVIVQQSLQTFAGLLYAHFSPPDMVGKEDYDIALWSLRIRIAQRGLPVVLNLMGVNSMGLAERCNAYPDLAGALLGGSYSYTQTTMVSGQPVLMAAFAPWEVTVAKAIYHALVPILQFVIAVCVIDTWQYFLHRLMHTSKYCYRTFHIRHHRLQAPYAYGALYNHPLEGFLGDTLGTGVAFMLAGMSTRQGMVLFTVATIKTIDDHCGYAFPWDPLQMLTANNAEYHDIHHQSWGMKTNFAQPFSTFWDDLLGTRWTGPHKSR